MAVKRNDRVRFTIRRPNPKEGRASFSIFKDTIRSGTRANYKISDPRIDAINADYKRGKLEFSRAEMELGIIRDELLRLEEQAKTANKVSLHAFNKKLLDRYKEDEIDLRQLRDPDEAYNKHLRAIKRLGNLSLRSVGQKELQKIVNTTSGNVQKKLISSYRALLKFIGRTDVRIFRGRSLEDDDQNAKFYLTRAEFMRVIATPEVSGDEALRAMYIVAFGTGARNGEIHGLTPEHLKSNGKGAYSIYIERQRYTPSTAKKRGKAFGPPKNRRHDAAVLEPDTTVEAFRQWVSIPFSERDKLRDRAGILLQEVCRKLWPELPRTHGRMHMLRASHAIELIRLGASIDQVARNLGDGVEVTQRHYARFVHTDSSLSALQALIKT